MSISRVYIVSVNILHSQGNRYLITIQILVQRLSANYFSKHPPNIMEINPKAPAIARHEIEIDASIDRIWQLLTDVDRWTDWHPLISEAKLDGLFKVGTSFRWKSGGSEIVSTLQEVEPQQRITWTGKVFGIQAIHVWILEPQGDGAIVRTEESFEGWIVSLLKGMMQKTLDTALQNWLALLKTKAETGD